jgi:hypothetical protein
MEHRPRISPPWARESAGLVVSAGALAVTGAGGLSSKALRHAALKQDQVA